MDETSVLIDFGNGASKHFVGLAWKDGMTLDDVLGAASDLAPGFETDVVFTRAGRRMLQGVDGVRRDDTSSWVIWIGQREVGGDIDDSPVAAGDEVALRFGA